jgi:hypothetical protein
MPSLASELRSKVITPEQRLYTLGCQAVNAPDRAAYEHDTIKLIAKSESLIVVLWRHYLETRIAPDMGGDALSSVRSGQRRYANDGPRAAAAPHGPVEGEEGHATIATQAMSGVPSSPSPLESGEAMSGMPQGQAMRASSLSPVDADPATATVPQSQAVLAGSASPVRDGTGQNGIANAGQNRLARPIAKPNPPRGPLAMALAQKDEDRKLFDSFKVRGGKPIGSLTLYEARQIAATNERESRVLRTLLNHIGEAWPGATIRDLINPQVLARAIGQNMEASDAA